MEPSSVMANQKPQNQTTVPKKRRTKSLHKVRYVLRKQQAFKCGVCGGDLPRGTKAHILREPGKEIAACAACAQRKVEMNILRQAGRL